MLWEKESAIAEFSPILPFHWSVVAFCGQISCIYEYETHFQVFVCLLSDLWRPCSSTGEGLRNGDGCSSSLAAKGYRSVRPIFQDKKSPTPVRSACLFFSSLLLLEVFLPQEMPVEAHSTGFINDIFNCSSHSRF